ncbi:MAG: hypothetical protein JXB47_03495 [Anaerolineae bacterium]|nr:hypothetical protein [Anaerolineae bacterium]
MPFRIGLENNQEGWRSVAWALQHPGCFAYGVSADAALAAMHDAVEEYAAWTAFHGEAFWTNTEVVKLHVDEVWDGYCIDGSYELAGTGRRVSAFFRYDWKPLLEAEVNRGLVLLSWGRADLMDMLEKGWRVAAADIAAWEWDVMDRLGVAGPRERLPAGDLDRLHAVREHLFRVLPALIGVERVVGERGELWSPRKMLRLLVWHERDRINQLQGRLSVEPLLSASYA